VTRVRRRYQPGDLDDAWYAVAAADDPAVNAAIAQEGERARAFCSGPAVNPYSHRNS
jgi:uroporphyrin-III C-methyltransferase / precorrin-2 dehydrogenase / sirohydrochlorin ferrochelatase